MSKSLADIVEEEVRQIVVRNVKTLGGLWVKNQKRQGWPDDSFYWLHGQHDIVEFKRPKGGRFEPLQERTMDKLVRMGHSVLLINSPAQAYEYILSRLPYAKPKAAQLWLKSNEHLRARRFTASGGAVSLQPAHRQDDTGNSADPEYGAPSLGPPSRRKFRRAS